MIDADLYDLSFEGLDLPLESEEDSFLNFGNALRGLRTAPSAMAVHDWQPLVEKLRRSAEALQLEALALCRSSLEDLRRAIDAIKGQLSGTLLRCRNDMVKALNRPFKIFPKSLHPVDYR